MEPLGVEGLVRNRLKLLVEVLGQVCVCEHLPPVTSPPQVSEVEVNGQIEAVCEAVFSEMESQAVDALDLPMSGCFRMRSHSYVRAIEKGCSREEEEEGEEGGGGGGVVAAGSRRSSSPPRTTTTTVRTIQSSTGRCQLPSCTANHHLMLV